MATRDQVLGLLREGHDYESAARELGIPAGRAFMIATGVPADGGEAASAEELSAGPPLAGSSQLLVNPSPYNPTTSEEVMAWVRARAARDLGTRE